MPGHGKWQIFSRKSAHCRDAGTFHRSYVRDRSRIAFDNADFFGSVEIFGRAVGRVVCVCVCVLLEMNLCCDTAKNHCIILGQISVLIYQPSPGAGFLKHQQLLSSWQTQIDKSMP